MSEPRRIAINAGGGHVPGLDLIAAGAALAAGRLGWELLEIRDGYDGVLHPDRYPEGGFRRLTPDLVRHGRGFLGTGARTDPFFTRLVNADGMVEEVDRSDEVLAALKAAGVEAVISVVGASAVTGLHALSVAWKLHRKGLPTICIPKSIENDVAETALAFGYNSALAHATELLERIRLGARDARRLAVVEVPGQRAGWLALQSGMAVLADAVLIPEIAPDLARLAETLPQDASLVVVAEGTRLPADASATKEGSLRGSLSPLSDPGLGEGARVIERAGAAAHAVALELQRRTGLETLPLSLGPLVRGGEPTAVDRQLGLGYGAAAVEAIAAGETAAMLVFQPPDLRTIPIREALHRVRTVPPDSPLVRIARGVGITLGD